MTKCRNSWCGVALWPWDRQRLGLCWSCYVIGRRAFLAGAVIAGIAVEVVRYVATR